MDALQQLVLDPWQKSSRWILDFDVRFHKLLDVGGLAQSVECVVSNDEAPGSKPGFSTFCFENVFSRNKMADTKKNTSGGIRTHNPRIRSPMRYPLRHWGKERPRWDSNPQPLDPKSSALSIAPRGHCWKLGNEYVYEISVNFFPLARKKKTYWRRCYFPQEKK